MTPITRAIWSIESGLAADLSLQDVAAQAGVTPHHLTRAFAATTGRSLMRYVRERRLTEAARLLAGGAPDILAVALAVGYQSHEGFTRAFRDHFGITPEAARERRGAGLTLTEPLPMKPDIRITLAPPRIVESPAFVLAGLDRRYTDAQAAAIPAQWQAFGPWIGRIPGQRGTAAFGVLHDGDAEGAVGYLTGVEVSAGTPLPADLVRLTLPARRYAVFRHPGHVSEIRGVWQAIWAEGLTEAAVTPAPVPEFERYGEGFDPATGHGGFEIWIPLGD